MRHIVTQIYGERLFCGEELAGLDGRERESGDLGGAGEIVKGIGWHRSIQGELDLGDGGS
jgi:hypothetical protein